jgi:alpha-1,2-mannosyltransferase
LHVQAELAGAPHQIRRQSWPLRKTLGLASLVVAALLFATAFIAFIADSAVHSGELLNWYDLNVYNDAGLITRQLPSNLYIWQLAVSIKFTYTPFAAIVFSGSSYLNWALLRWLMTLASVAAIPLAAWLTLGAVGRRGLGRVVMALAVGALGLWLEPVTKSLELGQIEPLLMLLIIWDLTIEDSRRWKGVGIGVAAGIKLVPWLCIPFLLLAGKVRQAIVAAATFAVTVLIGFAVLPGPSAMYWLTGYFIKPGRTGAVDALVNQSLLGMLARHAGGGPAAQPVWLPIAIVVALAGVGAGALLSRTGKPVAGWVLVGVTSVLVSPISWDHHWVWILPLLALIGGLMMDARGIVQTAYFAAGFVVAGVFADWPLAYSGSLAFVPHSGMLGWFVLPPQSIASTRLQGWQLLTWNLFVVVGSVIYLVMLGAAAQAWLRQRSTPRSPAPAPPTPVDAPIEALLARADAVLKPGGLAPSSGDSGAAQS